MDNRDQAGKFIKGSKVNQGRVPSEDQKRKQSEKMSGRVESDEHKAKIRAGMLASTKVIGRPKGGVPWNKGMKRSNGDPIPVHVYHEMSPEGRERQIKAISGKHFSSETEFKKGMKPWNTGKPCSDETKAKLKGQKRSGEVRLKMSNAKKGKPLSAEHIRKVLTRRTPTSLEKKFQNIVDKNNLPYKFVGDGSFMIERKNPDFINTNGHKIAIEVYARYYKLRHKETVQEWMDEREAIFNKYGWSVIFFDETQVNEKNVVKQLQAA